jgi:hypothetical protein
LLFSSARLRLVVVFARLRLARCSRLGFASRDLLRLGLAIVTWSACLARLLFSLGFASRDLSWLNLAIVSFNLALPGSL